MAAPAHSPEQILDRLRLVRVAKDLFLSEWYQRSCTTLQFHPETCSALDQIAIESREERDRALDLVREWADFLADTGEGARADELLRLTRADFLRGLLESKEAAGRIFEVAAILAPPGMREEFLILAAADFRHANMLRDLINKEVETTPRILPEAHR